MNKVPSTYLLSGLNLPCTKLTNISYMIVTLTPFSIKVGGSGETVIGASDRDDLLGGLGEVPPLASPEDEPSADPKLTGQENLFFFPITFGEPMGDDGVGIIGVLGVESGELVKSEGGSTANFVVGSTWVGNGNENENENFPLNLPSYF